MIDNIYILMIFYLELIVLLIFSKNIYDIKFKNTKINLLLGIAALVGVFLVILIIESKFTFRQFPFFIFGFSFLSAIPMLDSKNNIMKLLSASLMLKISSMLLWLVGNSIGLIGYDNFSYPTALLIIDGIIGVIVILLALWIKKRKKIFLPAEQPKKELIFFLFGETSLILMLCVITELSSHSSIRSEVSSPIIIISIGIMIFICYHMLSVKYENRYIKIEHDTALKLLNAQNNYYTSLLKTEEETKAFRHDIRNHIYCMKQLCDDGKYKELKQYLYKLSESQAISTTRVNSGDKLIDVIINELLITYPLINLQIFGLFNNDHVIEQIDICTIFSNLLTNAFEASEKSNDKIVRLHIKRLNSHLIIKIENSVDVAPVIENKNIRTTKSDVFHGYGLKNVRTSLEKYNGILELECDGNVFEASVIIPNVIETDR